MASDLQTAKMVTQLPSLDSLTLAGVSRSGVLSSRLGKLLLSLFMQISSVQLLVLPPPPRTKYTKHNNGDPRYRQETAPLAAVT